MHDSRIIQCKIRKMINLRVHNVMNYKIALKYISIYLSLNVTGISIASHFWWTDGLKLSYLHKETAFLLLSFGLCWIGVIYLSILISRKIKLKPDYFPFIGPIDIERIEILSKNLDEEIRKKLKRILPIIAFPIMSLTITSFILIMNGIKESQLNNYGKVEIVVVDQIQNDIKGIPYAIFKYNNDDFVLLPKNDLSINDKIEIIYSNKNPKIVEYYKDFKRE